MLLHEVAQALACQPGRAAAGCGQPAVHGGGAVHPASPQRQAQHAASGAMAAAGRTDPAAAALGAVPASERSARRRLGVGRRFRRISVHARGPSCGRGAPPPRGATRRARPQPPAPTARTLRTGEPQSAPAARGSGSCACRRLPRRVKAPHALCRSRSIALVGSGARRGLGAQARLSLRELLSGGRAERAAKIKLLAVAARGRFSSPPAGEGEKRAEAARGTKPCPHAGRGEGAVGEVCADLAGVASKAPHRSQ
jgi:hypothetical protein